MFSKYIFLLTPILCSQMVYAGGVSLGATRLVYPLSKEQETIWYSLGCQMIGIVK